MTRLLQDDSAKGIWQETWVPLNADKVESGNQGNVIEVRHVKTDQRGALKLMHERDKHHKERVQRFRREAIIRRQLVHPGLPAILDANLNESADTELFFVAEWIEGKTLQDLFGGNPTTADEAVRLSICLAQIVEYCHRNGVLHRDIKPSNIILRQQDQIPVLVDFGLAWKEEFEDEHLSSGQEIGNRFLRLADNIIGEAFDDPKTDVTFVVGILFFLLTGLAPRSVPHRNGRPPHEVLSGAIPAEVTGHESWKAVRTIFDIGFQTDARRRFQNVTELLTRLETITKGPGGRAPEVTDDFEGLRLLLDSERHRVEQDAIDCMLDASRRLRTLIDESARKLRLGVSVSGPSYVDGSMHTIFHLHRQQISLPQTVVEHFIRISGPSKSYFTASYSLEGSEQRTYYHNAVADSDGLINAVVENGNAIFREMVSDFEPKLRLQDEV